MPDLGMAAACVLALTFAWAGAAKLGRQAETAAGFAELGLRRSYALARIVPFVELGLAVGLLAAPSGGAVAALAMLLAFSVVLARALRRGGEVRCACFGQVAGPPLSWVELVRNGLLAALAGVAVAAGPDPRVPALLPAVAVVVIVTAAALLLSVVRSSRR